MSKSSQQRWSHWARYRVNIHVNFIVANSRGRNTLQTRFDSMRMANGELGTPGRTGAEKNGGVFCVDFSTKERPLVFVSIMRDLIYVQALCAITSSVNTATANWILGWAPLSNDISWRVSRPTQFTISPRIVIQYRTRMLDWIECCNIVLQQNVETDWLGTP